MTSQAVDVLRIKTIEERAMNAWPALHTVETHGWVLRFANGYTKRANSVNALEPDSDFGELLRVATQLYSEAGLPLIFRLSPLAPPAADAELDRRNLRRIDETIVMTAALDRNIQSDGGVIISPTLDPEWTAGFVVAHAISPHHQGTHDRMLALIRRPAAYAMIVEQGRPIAFGLAVCERGMSGIFDVVTAPAFRRRGAARRLTSSLMAWGARQGAVEAYLQVTVQNRAARALYESLGFAEAYRYHYRVRD